MIQPRQRRRLPAVQVECLEGRQLLSKNVVVELFDSAGDMAPADVYTGSLGAGTVTIDLPKQGLKQEQGQNPKGGGGSSAPTTSLSYDFRKHYDHAIVTTWDDSPKAWVQTEKVVLRNLNLQPKAVVTVDKGGVTIVKGVTYSFASETVVAPKSGVAKSLGGKMS